MLKLRLYMVGLVLLSLGCTRIQKPVGNDQNYFAKLEAFNKNDRVLILAPHPDDESIACAGIIQKAIAIGAQVKIVYLTNGDHNELAFIVYEKRLTFRQGEFIYMGKVRQKESIKAMKFLGLPEKNLIFLGYPDYGTFEIFCKYWQPGKPFRDRLTRISSVPYKENPSYGAEYIGGNILADLTKQILDYQPNKIFVSHPGDVNVDHKTLYLFLQVALSDLEERIAKPQIYPYLVHCVGWPKPRHYHPELELYPPNKFVDCKLNWFRSDLNAVELDRKYRSILYYKSQTQSSAFYLFSFARKNELFSDYASLELKSQQGLEGNNILYSDASVLLREEEFPSDLKEFKSFEGAGSLSYALEGGYFVVRLDKPKKLSNSFGVLLHIFGYNKSIPFTQMPKIRIITRGKNCKVFNSKERVIDSGVSVDFGRNFLVIKVPLKFAGQPDYVLTALKDYHGNLPIDVVAFRKIKTK